ncbi:hypothetical protein [Rhodovulum sp. YEN HP10]|uniref:hypothetical protein n=1 Tax=Rhodovulum sp. HP10 TaxID=3387397 RepID=UPI0039DFED61
MSAPDTVIMADWSARSGHSPARPTADAIWIAVARRDATTLTAYFRSRAGAEAALADLLDEECRAGRRVLLGGDFAFGYPAGLAGALTGTASARAVWAWLEDGPDNRNSRSNWPMRSTRPCPEAGRSGAARRPGRQGLAL